MRTEKIKAVQVSGDQDGGEYYTVGKSEITSIEWGETSGHMASLDTIRVFKDGALWSEHLFTNCLSVYFARKEPGHGE